MPTSETDRTMTRRAPTAALLALFLVLPAPGLAQEAEAGERAEAKMERVRSQLGADGAARIQEAVTKARDAGVPAGPVLDKALEGIAKGVPAARLAPAVEAYAERLARAAAVLGEGPPPAEIVAAADALGRGVPEGQLRAVRRVAGPEDRAIALVVLGDLVEMGVPADRAAGAIRDAIAAGRGGETLLHLPGLVRRRLRAGTPPGQAAEQAREALKQAQPAGPPVPPGSGPPGQGQGKGPPEGAGPPPGESLSRGGA